MSISSLNYLIKNDTLIILLYVLLLDKMISFDLLLGITFKTNLDLIFFF